MVKVKDKKNTSWAIYFAVGTQVAVSIVVGLIAGSAVDKWMEMETPVFALVGLVAGMISGFAFLIKIINRKNDDSGDDSGKN